MQHYVPSLLAEEKTLNVPTNGYHLKPGIFSIKSNIFFFHFKHVIKYQTIMPISNGNINILLIADAGHCDRLLSFQLILIYICVCKYIDIHTYIYIYVYSIWRGFNKKIQYSNSLHYKKKCFKEKSSDRRLLFCANNLLLFQLS